MNDERIFHAATNAITFYSAAKRCNMEGMLPLSTPSIICGAFSVELAIKSLLYKNGIETKGHQLLKLLQQLPTETQKEIYEGLEKEWVDFEAQLANCDKAFVDWRYAHETTSDLNINSNFLVLLAEVCCKIVMRELGIRSNVSLNDMI